mmetsp:Transcript_13830/g.25045  ORF Transcript_13830/g.25045 Transcript_13830/m.25045 type:complete len:89 (+) Transcript_13830:349-615(+)
MHLKGEENWETLLFKILRSKYYANGRQPAMMIFSVARQARWPAMNTVASHHWCQDITVTSPQGQIRVDTRAGSQEEEQDVAHMQTLTS